MKIKLSKMIYLGGHSGRKGLLGILAFPEAFPSETEFTMFYTTFEDKWWQLQFKFDISSLTYLSSPGTDYRGWWLVGKRGEVVEFTGGEPRIERIETAGTGPHMYGYLSQIRVIDGELFVCGYGRQVYKRSQNKWELISKDILNSGTKEIRKGFEAIDGFSKNDLYAAGDGGEIWHFDGSKWTRCDSPTDKNLADIRCFNGKVWACGDGGVILCGDKNGWEIVWQGDDPSESWWSIESFQDKIYVAGDDFLGTIDKGKIVKVDVKIKEQVTTGTLHQKEGILWSIGEKDILVFSGNEWRELTVPENR